MTICTVIKAGRTDEFGRSLAVGQVYTGVQAFVRDLVNSGYATTTDSLVDGGFPANIAPADSMNSVQVGVIQALVSGAWNPPQRLIGDDLGQPAGITQSVTSIGKLAARFGSGQWSVSNGAPTLTQGYTGWDGSGAKTGITSRTGQPDMLKVVPAANTTEGITLGTFATNMLVKSLNGRFGIWVYLEAQPGYQVGGALAGTMEVALTTSGTAYTNGLNVGFNNNQLREGWNFLVFRMRNFAAYQPASGVAEDHPFGMYVTSNGTAADANILASAITAIRIVWANLQGATLYFDSIWTNFDATPQVCLGCDQGANFEEIALPLFDSYGWTGYLAYPYNVADNNGSTVTVQSALDTLPAPGQEAQMRLAYSKGWDIINHSLTHAALGTYSAEASIAWQMEQSRGMWMARDFVRGSEFYASPASSSSRLSEKVIKGLGFKIQRHARRTNTQMTPWGIDNPHHVGAFGWGSNASPTVAVATSGANSSVSGNQQFSKIKRAIDVIVAYGATGHIFWHGITTLGDSGGGEDLTGDNLLLTASAFRLSCAYIRQLEQAGTLRVCKGMSGFYYGTT